MEGGERPKENRKQQTKTPTNPQTQNQTNNTTQTPIQCRQCFLCTKVKTVKIDQLHEIYGPEFTTKSDIFLNAGECSVRPIKGGLASLARMRPSKPFVGGHSEPCGIKRGNEGKVSRRQMTNAKESSVAKHGKPWKIPSPWHNPSD